LIQVTGQKKKPGRGAAGLFRGALFSARLLVREQHNNGDLSKVFQRILEKSTVRPHISICDRARLHRAGYAL
jgi:hypothetical protein